MREISAFEAKNRLGQRLDGVEQGKEVTITRRGKAVARVVASPGGASRDDAGAAAQSIRDMSTGITLGDLTLKDLIDDGRC
jgi:prevent-host-death family protein